MHANISYIQNRHYNAGETLIECQTKQNKTEEKKNPDCLCVCVCTIRCDVLHISTVNGRHPLVWTKRKKNWNTTTELNCVCIYWTIDVSKCKQQQRRQNVVENLRARSWTSIINCVHHFYFFVLFRCCLVFTQPPHWTGWLVGYMTMIVSQWNMHFYRNLSDGNARFLFIWHLS